MPETEKKRISQFFLIANAKKKEKFIALLQEHGARGIETMYAHSSVTAGALARAFGFEVEESKVLVSCLLRYEQAEACIDILCRDYHFDKPNTGIAFSVPVEGLVF